ncbi:MAG TPA: hypothetical protein VEI02_07070 [Planctomycetota bacterium]|nr:hypothetical protein [Planctomycetota bacterium]
MGLRGPLLVLALVLPGAAFAQHRQSPPDPSQVPDALRLKGDPASTAELGGARAAPAPARGVDKSVTWFGACCRTCLDARAQNPAGPTPKPPPLAFGQPRDVAAAWLERLSGCKPHFFHLPATTLACALPESNAADLSAEEAARLRVWFPDLPATPQKLTAHQAAHVWADRLVALDAAIADLLDLDDEGRLKVKAGPYGPVAYERGEVVVFADPKAARAFDEYLFGPDVWSGAGGVFTDRPTTSLALGELSPAMRRRRFAFAAASTRLRAVSRMERGVAPWMRVGLAHFFEHRAAPSDAKTDDAASGSLPPDFSLTTETKPPPDRALFVRETIHAGVAPRFDALALSTEEGLSTRSRLCAWGVTRFLIGLDRAKYAALWRRLAAAQPGAPREKAFAEAVKETYGVDVPTLDNAWRVWAVSK